MQADLLRRRPTGCRGRGCGRPGAAAGIQGDAQYLNTTVAELGRAVLALAIEGLIRAADEEFGAATEKLMERRESYQAQLAWMLEFIRPSFNEEMRHGQTNM